MRLSKFLSITCGVTLFSILYVSQQTEIFRLAYMGERKASFFNDLVDKNAVLRYNIQRNSSLTVIGTKVPQSAAFEIPDTYQVVRLAPREGLRFASGEPLRKENMFSRIFSVKRQAEAKTVELPRRLP